MPISQCIPLSFPLCVYMFILYICVSILALEIRFICTIFLGEGNGTPLQYSCLENPMDGGAWWTAVHGVAQSRTRLSDLAAAAAAVGLCAGKLGLRLAVHSGGRYIYLCFECPGHLCGIVLCQWPFSHLRQVRLEIRRAGGSDALPAGDLCAESPRRFLLVQRRLHCRADLRDSGSRTGAFCQNQG